MKLTTFPINKNDHPDYFANNWLIAKSKLDTGQPFVCIPTITDASSEDLNNLNTLVSDLPKDLPNGHESSYGHMYEQKNIIPDSKHFWNWNTNRDYKIKILKNMLNENPPQNIMNHNGMLNCYGTKIHQLLGLSIAKGLEECYPEYNIKLGHNRMKLTLGSEWRNSVNIKSASYHIEGQKTGIKMNELKNTIYFGIIVPLPSHKRGFCSFKYKLGATHETFIEALIRDREINKNIVKSPKFFTSINENFWNDTEAGQLLEPISIIVPENHTILFNAFLPHGISNACRNVSVYIDTFLNEEPAEKRHNHWHSIQKKWEEENSGYDINADVRTISGSNKYPTKGYYDTYKYNWKIHKIWCLLMKSAPSHWPSGKETFAVHTSGYGTAKKKGLLNEYHVPNNSNLVRFHYRKERPILLTSDILTNCINKGFKFPDILLNTNVIVDPSTIDSEFAIRFGFEKV